MNAIQTLGLSKRYGRYWAADRLTLTVKRGEVFGLVGPNGAGKSTFVRLLMGLIRPTSGAARILGKPLGDVGTVGQVGYLPELFRYPFWLSALEVLAFHARLLHLPWKEEDGVALLRQVGLEDAAGARIRTYSKGMQQRLGLAAALVGSPHLVILDEPTSALDPLGRHDVRQLILQLRSQGTTVFLNSHLLSEMEGLVDGIALLDRGRIVYAGTPDGIRNGRAHRHRFFVRSVPPGAVEQMAAYRPDLEALPDGVALTVTVFREGLPALHRLLMRLDIDIYESQPLDQSLERWFIESVRPSNGGDA